jgi:hypothetical protein
MILASILGGKFLIGKMSAGKVASISMITSTISDALMGTITYHYWDGKKNKHYTTSKHKKRRW